MIVSYYIVACCFLVWIGISIWAVKYSRAKWSALFFTPVEARITDTRLVEELGISSSDGPDSRVTRHLEFTYRFTVDGREYRGSDEGGAFEFPSGRFSERKPGEKPLYKGKMGPGDPVTVYFNPADPGENTHRRFAFVGGLVSLAFGQLFLLLAIHLIRNWR